MRDGCWAISIFDSTGGSGLSNSILGYAEKYDDKLAFIFADDAGRFHTTFSYDRANDAWSWTMDSEKDGQFKPFARLTIARAFFPLLTVTSIGRCNT